MSSFEASVRHVAGMTILDLAGTIDADAEPDLIAAYARSDEHPEECVALSFAAVEFINSTGIALLVSLLARAKRDGRPVRAWGLTDHFREIFGITRLDDFLEVFADEQSARGASEHVTGEG